ncbi:MAG: hypothetical protein Q6L60_14905 [Thermostichus sp. HHBFW_bins_43]
MTDFSPLPEPTNDTTGLGASLTGSLVLRSKEPIPLGQQLLRAGLLTKAQLAQALREQQQTHLRIGEFCLEKQWVSPQQLYQFTSSQSLCLGEILVARGYIEFDQLRIALAQQRRYGRKLGEILVWKGWIQPTVLEQILTEQEQLRRMPEVNAWQVLSHAVPEGLDPAEAAEAEDLEELVDLAGAPQVEGSERAELLVREGNGEQRSPGALVPTAQPQIMPEPTEIPFSDVELETGTPITQLTGYRNRVAALELELEMQQREWDAAIQRMNEQVVEFQRAYQERIQTLENRLQQVQQERSEAEAELVRVHQLQVFQLRELLAERQAELQSRLDQQAQQATAHAALVSSYQQRIQELEAQQTKLRQALAQEQGSQQAQLVQLRQELDKERTALAEQQQQARQQELLVLQLHRTIDELEANLAQQAEAHAQERQALLARHQEQISHLQAQLAEQHQASQQAQQARQEVEHLRAQLQQLSQTLQQMQPIQQRYQALTQQVQPLVQQLNQAKAHIAKLGEALQRSRTSQQHYQQLAQKQQAQLQQAQATTARLSQELAAVQKQLTTLSEQQHLAQQLHNARQLMKSYRQSLETLQQELKAEQMRNRLLQAQLERQQELSRRIPTHGTNPSSKPSDDDTMPTDPATGSQVLTPWVRQLFIRLRKADLITRQQVQEVLELWQHQGGKLTDILTTHLGLQDATIRFFSDEGYVARLSGCRRLGEYLRAAGLVTDEELQRALQIHRQSGLRLGETLVQQGLIRPSTANYFAHTFTQAQQPDQPA